MQTVFENESWLYIGCKTPAGTYYQVFEKLPGGGLLYSHDRLFEHAVLTRV